MSQADREKWNQAYRARANRLPPSAFVTGLAAWFPARGRALDVAGGAGRHALWLAGRGLEVTLADVSDVALAEAAQAAAGAGVKFATLQLDLEAEPLPPGPWDVILCSFFLHRPLFAQFAEALAPGGVLAVAHPTRRNLERHPKPGAAFLLEEGELAAFARGLEVIACDEGWRESGVHEARLIARLPVA